MTEQTSFGKALKESLRAKAVREVAETFEVNPVVARIRLQEMFPVERNQKF
jgi:hypothetical protein